MSMLTRTTLTEHEAAAALKLFTSIVDAERGNLTAKQAANPREYLLDAWHKAAEAVMRPIHTREQLEEELERLRDSDLDETVPF